MPRDWSDDSVTKQLEKIMSTSLRGLRGAWVNTKLQIHVYVLICSAHETDSQATKIFLSPSSTTIAMYGQRREFCWRHIASKKRHSPYASKTARIARVIHLTPVGDPSAALAMWYAKPVSFDASFSMYTWTFHLFSSDNNVSWKDFTCMFGCKVKKWGFITICKIRIPELLQCSRRDIHGFDSTCGP